MQKSERSGAENRLLIGSRDFISWQFWRIFFFEQILVLIIAICKSQNSERFWKEYLKIKISELEFLRDEIETYANYTLD